MPQVQVGQLPGPGRGGEAGEPVPADVGEPQLRARMRAFLADDDPQSFRPAGQVEQSGELGDPGAVADLPVAVISRRPRPRRDLHDRLLRFLGESEPDRVGQPPARFGQPGQELVRASAGVSADQYLPPHLARQLRQRQPGRLDVIGGGVGPGVAGPEHDGQRLAGPVAAVVGEHGQGMESPGFLPRRRGLFLVGVRGHDGGVDVHRHQAAVRARRGLPGQRPGPLPRGGTRGPDGFQRGRTVGGQPAYQPGNDRVGRNRAEQVRLGAQHFLR